MTDQNVFKNREFKRKSLNEAVCLFTTNVILSIKIKLEERFFFHSLLAKFN